MPRKPRVVIPNCFHHITQRGNNRQDVFFSDSDREVYLGLLSKYARKYEVDVLGYCLMTNHIHVIASPTKSTGLAKALGRAHNDYARWLNVRRGESGHLWQNRYFSCPIESRYLWSVLAYVERNPVRAGMVSRCGDWPWSSAATHSGHFSRSNWLTLTLWAQNWTPTLWHAALESGLCEAEIRSRLLEATQTGRPLGDDSFVAACELESGLKLGKQKPGRKPMWKLGSEANTIPRVTTANTESW